MNKVFKVIWNHATQTWTAVSELGHAKGKTKSKKIVKLTALAGAVIGSLAATQTVEAAESVMMNDNSRLAISPTAGESYKKAEAVSTFAIAIGVDSKSDSGIPDGTIDAATGKPKTSGTVAIGLHAQVKPDAGKTALAGIAIGDHATATQDSALAIGAYNSATGTSSTAIGKSSSATNNNAIAVGTQAKATADNAISAGAYNEASGERATSIGVLAQASGAGSFAGGASAQATGANSVAIGGAQDGTLGNEAAKAGTAAKAIGNQSIAVGTQSNANGDNSIAQGNAANASAVNATAIGTESTASGQYATALGTASNATAIHTVAIGSASTASKDGAFAGGYNATAAEKKSVALGFNAQANHENSVALGSGSVTGDKAPFANLEVAGKNYNFAGTKLDGVVSIGTKDKERQIQNVGAGRISSTSTDAVNGSQLYAVADAVSNHHWVVGGNTTAQNTSVPRVSDHSEVKNKDIVEFQNGNGTKATIEHTEASKSSGTPAKTVVKYHANIVNGDNTEVVYNEDGSVKINAKVAGGTDTTAAVTTTTTDALSVTNTTTGNVTTYNVDAKTGAISTTTVGAATYEKDGDKKDGGNYGARLTNVSTVTDIVNNVSWHLNSSQVTGTNGKITEGSDKEAADVKASNTVNINAGKNIEIKRNGTTIEISSTAGEKGEKGDTGATGAKGEKGDTGEKGGSITGEVVDNEDGTHTITITDLETGSVTTTIVKDGKNGKDGAAGAKGDTGATGAKGEKGDTGAAGAKGDTGAAGAKGEKGDTGAAGAKGDTGAKGEKGDTGAAGAKGEKGDTGAAGAKGEKGDTGAAGAKGDTGAAGAKGDTGDKGADGKDGASTQATVTRDEAAKTSTIVITNTDKEGNVTSTTAVVKDGKDGATGAKGDTGATGAKGDTGATGAKGDTGATGAKGDTGATGAKGDTGATGAKGDTGATGAKGDTGAKGEKGDKGDTGEKGGSITGEVVDNGDGTHTITITDLETGSVTTTIVKDGKDGVDGKNAKADVKDNGNGTHTVTITDGEGNTTTTIIKDGATGAKGDKGDKGDTGATGAKGDKGDKGDTGATGEKGDKGDKGDTGATGEKGEKGEKGDKGDTGEKGGSITGEVVDNGDGTHTITITDLETGSVTTTIVKDGKDGVDGKNAKADVKDNGNGTHTVTITDGEGNTTTTIVKDGKNAEAEVKDNGNGTHTVTIKDGNGNTTTTIVKDGAKGEKGDTGADGKNAEAEVKDNGNGTHTVTIKDGNGNTTTTIVKDGAKGEKGDKGDKGEDGVMTWDIKSTGNTVPKSQTDAKTIEHKNTVEMVAGKNLTVNQTNNSDGAKVEFALNSTVTNLDKVVVNGPKGPKGEDGKDGVTITAPVEGKDGKDGSDGKVGISGKDGKDAVSISGKDGVGQIGLTGPKGKDGKDGASINITTDNGKQTLVNREVGADGKPGETTQRIIYVPTDKDGNPLKDENGNTIKREVATMDDGLVFGGNTGEAHKAALGTQVNVKGADTNTDWSKFDAGENIMTKVDTATKTITVGLAKDLKVDNVDVKNNVTANGTISAPTIKAGDTTITNGKVANLKHHIENPTTVVDDKVLNITDGEKKEAATVRDVLNSGWNLQANGNAVDAVTHGNTVNFVDGKGITVKAEPNKDGTTSKVSFDVNVDNDTITVNDKGQLVSNGSTNFNVATKDGGNKVAKKGGSSTTKITSGKTITYTAGKNIAIEQNGGDILVSTTDDVNHNSVTTKDLTVNKGGNVDMGGNQVHNVKAGTKDTDAVNVSQLKQSIGDVHKRINKVGKEARGGIAGANAAAGLPQVYIPGKSMVAASAGTFKGESAVAVGYSRSSDNGKVIFKLQGNANTQGDVGGSVGVGYQW